MTQLFLYHNGTRGEVLLSRAIHEAALAAGFELTLGVCRGDDELMHGLAGPRCRIAVADCRNTAHGAPIDLAAMAPGGVPAIEVQLGADVEWPSYQWGDTVEAFQLALRTHGIDAVVGDADTPAPMLDFAAATEVGPLRRPAIFVDNSRTANDACYFVYDLGRLAAVFADWDLLCTGPIDVDAANVIDVSAATWSQRSRLSEQCDALVGTTLDPFVATMTSANRWKPKALCGYDARVTAPFWDYPGNPMELLASMDDLVDFLLANVAEVRCR